MRKLDILLIIALIGIIFISSCTPTTTPYVSNMDPCDPDILTAIASAGAIPRCDKIPTVTPITTPLSIEKERENEVVSLLNSVIRDPRYDPSKQVLAIYITNIYVDIVHDDILGKDGLHFHIVIYPTNTTDIISLAAELIYAGTLVSHAGESNDWKLGIIDVNYPKNSNSCSTSYYVNNEYDLQRIYQDEISIYDVMEVYVWEIADPNLCP